MKNSFLIALRVKSPLSTAVMRYTLSVISALTHSQRKKINKPLGVGRDQ